MVYFNCSPLKLGDTSPLACFFMAKKLDIADQYLDNIPNDESLRMALVKFADIIDAERRLEIWQYYHDPKLHKAYQAHRNFNALNNNGMTDKGYGREIVRIPPVVYQFLQDYFRPKYGQKWIQNKKVLRHELVRPWWIVPKV